MLVLVDLEWITNQEQHIAPTQLSAIKVDAQWHPLAEFDERIRPRDESFHCWKHMAYHGGTAQDFLSAPTAVEVFSKFDMWLQKDDVLLWWHQDSIKTFERLYGLLMRQKSARLSKELRFYLYEYLKRNGSAYQLAEKLGIHTRPSQKHFSKNDVTVLMQLLQHADFPQERLWQPLRKKEVANEYQYDPKTGLLHKSDCPKAGEGIAVLMLKTALRKGYRPCSCCKKEYEKAQRERNKDLLQRSEYNYVYAPGSGVFHRKDCGQILRARQILGATRYATAEKTGRCPCKICQPLPEEPRLQKKKQVVVETPSNEERYAMKRQQQALKERTSCLREGLTEQEKDDLYTLTQPRFAFWVAAGYKNFHLRSCPRLKGLSMLKGFSFYNEAMQEGYTPCRCCKPSAKYDMRLSVPINNQCKSDETVEDLMTRCLLAGFSYKKEKRLFYLETPVGKWCIHTKRVPFRLEHINLVTNPNADYHFQPRLFLSLMDAFDYIKRHDEALLEKSKDPYWRFVNCC